LAAFLPAIDRGQLSPRENETFIGQLLFTRREPMRLTTTFLFAALLCLPLKVYGQQITPNPNPYAHFLALNGTGNVNNVLYKNSGSIFNQGTLTNHATLHNLADGQLNNQETLNNYGTLTNNNDLWNRRTLNNYGTLHNLAWGTATNAGTLNNHDTLTNQGGTLRFKGGSSFANTGGTLINYTGGKLKFEGGSSFANTGGTLENNGTIESYIDNYYQTLQGGLGGTVHFNSGSTFANHATITNEANKTINNSETLTNESGAHLTNNGTLNNESGAHLTNEGTLTNTAHVDNYGMLTNNHDATLTNNGALNNHDTLNNNGTLTNNNHLWNRRTLNNDGTLYNNGTFANDGTYTGSGHIIGSWTDHGVTKPGNSSGVVTIDGNYYKRAGSTEIELGGHFHGGGDKSLTEFDWLDVTGNVELAGALNVYLIDSFELLAGISFEILNVGGTLTGQYDGLGEGALVGNFGGEDLFITYTAGSGNDVALYTIPEPTTLLLALLALVAAPLRVRCG
jgi:hypothetical protein